MLQHMLFTAFSIFFMKQQASVLNLSKLIEHDLFSNTYQMLSRFPLGQTSSVK